MQRNSIFLAAAIAFIGLGAMGSECDPDDDPTGDNGTDGGVTGDCRDDGTCQPNLYSDTGQGAYDTSSYVPRLLISNGSVVGANTGGNFVRVNGYAEDQQIRYWLVSEVTAGNNPAPVDVFAGTDAFSNRIYYVVDEDGNLVGDPIVDVAPDAEDYSPLYQIYTVEVPDGYTADTLKSVATVQTAGDDPDTGIRVEATQDVVVIAFVDPSVGFQSATGSEDEPQQIQAWYDGYELFGWFIPGGNTDGTLPVTSQGANQPPVPYLSDLYQFDDPSLCIGRNVYSDVYGGIEYSPVPVLHFTRYTGACDQLPTNAGAVVDAISGGDFEVSGDIVVVAPQAP